MVKDELIAALRLQQTPHIGDILAKRLIAHCGSPSAVFLEKSDHLLRIEGIGTRIITCLKDNTALKAAEKEFKYIVENNINYTYFKDQEYPKYLKHCADAPLLLFQKGNIQLQGRKIISVVGTRNITRYGRAVCEEFIETIAPLNPIIVSGMAYGVDICIQKAAAELQLQTIGCLAHGLNQMYPKAHQKYCDLFEKNGGFMTEFWSSATPEREHFLKRNRIIAGISEATVVIESAEKGGSLVTADIANSYDREVFAVPGRANDTNSTGCNSLIKQQKAHMLTSAADLIYILNWDVVEAPPKPIQKELFTELDEVERIIYTFLETGGQQGLDIIALECHLPVFKTSSTLLSMELKGFVRPLPGKRFEAI
jgi:DNA processing protein